MPPFGYYQYEKEILRSRRAKIQAEFAMALARGLVTSVGTISSSDRLYGDTAERRGQARSDGISDPGARSAA